MLLLLVTALLVALVAVVLVAPPAGAQPLAAVAPGAPGPSPPPWLAGAAMPAMAVAAGRRASRRSRSFHPDLPGGP